MGADELRLLADGGSFVLVAWLVIHWFKVAFPRLTEVYERTLREQRHEFLAALTQERRYFAEMLALLADIAPDKIRALHGTETPK